MPVAAKKCKSKSKPKLKSKAKSTAMSPSRLAARSVARRVRKAPDARKSSVYALQAARQSLGYGPRSFKATRRSVNQVTKTKDGYNFYTPANSAGKRKRLSPSRVPGTRPYLTSGNSIACARDTARPVVRTRGKGKGEIACHATRKPLSEAAKKARAAKARKARAAKKAAAPACKKPAAKKRAPAAACKRPATSAKAKAAAATKRRVARARASKAEAGAGAVCKRRVTRSKAKAKPNSWALAVKKAYAEGTMKKMTDLRRPAVKARVRALEAGAAACRR